MSRAVVEDCLPLDIRRLNRESWRFGLQMLTYTSGASISFVGTREALKLSYRAAGEPVDEAIAVVTSAMHFGGSREFFLCPRCGRRFAILYCAARYFRCRRCNDMAYRTQNETPHGRALLLAGKLWKLAGCEWGGDGEKPKWMQWRTFNRLMERADEAYGASWDAPIIRRLMAEHR